MVIIMIEKELFALFKASFIRNCELDGAGITEEEVKTLEELDTEEIFENFKDLVNDLLSYKEKLKQSSESEIVERSEQFEALIQKLEGEVRSHIGIQHQLKLHVENTQSKLEEVQTLYEKAKQTISGLENRNPKDEHSKKINRIIAENQKLKKIVEEKSTEIETLRKKNELFRNDKAQAKPFKVTRDLLRVSKKETLKKDHRPISRGNKSISRQHVRSISDNRSFYGRRAPSR